MRIRRRPRESGGPSSTKTADPRVRGDGAIGVAGRIFPALLVLLGALGAARAEETPAVGAQLSPSAVRLGDVVALTLEARRPNGFSVEWPAAPKRLGQFEVRASSPLPAEVRGEVTIDRLRLELQGFTTGQQTLPGLPVLLRDLLGRPRIARSPDLTVTVSEVPPGPKDKGDIRGIKGVIGPSAWPPWWWVVAVFLLSALCFLLWRKRRRAQQGPPPPPPPVPADEEALRRLARLLEGGPPAAGRIKEFYSALSDVLRTYLERGFGIPALERTTGELLRDVRQKSVCGDDRLVELKGLLEECDLVKFAKFRPDASEAEKAHAAATRFVQATRILLKKDGGAPPSGRP